MMIVLYSGTPGSGKSLDCARTIYNWLRLGKTVLCNFQVNVDNIKLRGKKDIRYIPNHELEPDSLVAIAREHFEGRRVKEDSILLIIDEAQLLFNSRDWTMKGRERWTWFFTTHRHFGYFILLCAQFDRMLDRQIRGLIEYEFIHRKVSNIGWRGWFLSLVMMAPGMLFVKVKVWYPMKEKVGSEFYRCQKKYYSLYDTFALLDSPDRTKAGGGVSWAGQRTPEAACDPPVDQDAAACQEGDVSDIVEEADVSEKESIISWIKNLKKNRGKRNVIEAVKNVQEMEADLMQAGDLPDSDFLSEGEVKHA